MKKYVLLVFLLPLFSLVNLSAQIVHAAGLQCSSSRLGFSFPLPGFNMGSELSAYAFLGWGGHMLLAPEVGIRQQNRSYILPDIDLVRFRRRAAHIKLSVLIPFSKKFHNHKKGWFASVGFSQNVGFHFREEQIRDGEVVSLVEVDGVGHEGDLHVGLGYCRPLSHKLNLLIRAEYAEGMLTNSLRNGRRNELSLGIGLGFSGQR